MSNNDRKKQKRDQKFMIYNQKQLDTYIMSISTFCLGVIFAFHEKYSGSEFCLLWTIGLFIAAILISLLSYLLPIFGYQKGGKMRIYSMKLANVTNYASFILLFVALIFFFFTIKQNISNNVENKETEIMSIEKKGLGDHTTPKPTQQPSPKPSNGK